MDLAEAGEGLQGRHVLEDAVLDLHVVENLWVGLWVVWCDVSAAGGTGRGWVGLFVVVLWWPWEE